MKTSLYDFDFYAWSNKQAALLRGGMIAEADIENIAEEIESMGKTEKKELVSRLAVLLLHLLKWQYQSTRRSRSWEATIKTQRNKISRHLAQNPSLKAHVQEVVGWAFEDARLEASGETELPESTFPQACPWTFDQIVDAGFWPGQSGKRTEFASR